MKIWMRSPIAYLLLRKPGVASDVSPMVGDASLAGSDPRKLQRDHVEGFFLDISVFPLADCAFYHLGNASIIPEVAVGGVALSDDFVWGFHSFVPFKLVDEFANSHPVGDGD